MGVKEGLVRYPSSREEGRERERKGALRERKEGRGGKGSEEGVPEGKDASQKEPSEGKTNRGMRGGRRERKRERICLMIIARVPMP